VQELAGLVFAYLGPQPAPLLPRWDRRVRDNAYRVIGFIKIPCNWLQCSFCALQSVTGQDVMAWVSQGPITDRTKERLGDTDRGVILFRQRLFQQIKRMEAGEDPIKIFRDPAENQCIDLPVPWDRGYAWGYAKDGTYLRGSATAA
jgi:hypothetical protein